MYIAIVFITGCFIAIMPILNGKFAGEIGTYKVSFNNYLFGFIMTVLFSLFVFMNSGHFIASLNENLLSTSGVPLHYYIGGLLGIAILLCFNFIAQHIPAFYVVIIPLVGQMLMGFVIDALKGQQLSYKNIAGVLLVIIGLMIYSRKTNTASKANQKKELNPAVE